jgi:alpha-ribazole phosphatase
MTRLLLTRHGETDWNARQRYQGQTDVPLNETGRRQAAALAKRLAGEKVSAILASDLQRSQETALEIAALHGLPVQTEPRLREIALGEWEGLTYAQARERWAEEMDAWFADPLHVAPPGGETLAQVSGRIQSVLEKVGRFGTDETIILASHGGPLRVLLCLALGMDVQAHWRFRLDVASISELYLYESDVVLIRLNDTHHLDAF